MSDELKDTPNLDGLTDLERSIAETNREIRNAQTAHPEPAPATPAPPPVNDWEALYRAQVERTKHLEDVIELGKLAPVVPHQNRDARPPITAEQLRAQWGDLRFLHKSTRAEKIAAFGENPANVDDGYLKTCFGRGNSGVEASELMKRDPLRYRTLKEIARALDLFGK